MKSRWKIKGILIGSILFLYGSDSQSQYILFTNTLNSGGFYFQNDQYKFSSNIGEMSLVNTFVVPEYILTHGVLQPLRLINTPVNTSTPIQVRLYPTILKTEMLFLQIQSETPVTGSLFLNTVDGKLIFLNKFQTNSNSAVIRMELPLLAPGLYLAYIQMIGARDMVYHKKTFKIIKY